MGHASMAILEVPAIFNSAHAHHDKRRPLQKSNVPTEKKSHWIKLISMPEIGSKPKPILAMKD